MSIRGGTTEGAGVSLPERCVAAALWRMNSGQADGWMNHDSDELYGGMLLPKDMHVVGYCTRRPA